MIITILIKKINIKKLKYKKENDNYTLYRLEWGVVGDVSDEGKWSIEKIAPWFFQENITKYYEMCAFYIHLSVIRIQDGF